MGKEGQPAAQASSGTNLISLTGKNESLEMHTILEEELKSKLPFFSSAFRLTCPISSYSIHKACQHSLYLLFTYLLVAFLFGWLVWFGFVLDRVSLLCSSGIH